MDNNRPPDDQESGDNKSENKEEDASKLRSLERDRILRLIEETVDLVRSLSESFRRYGIK